MNFIGSNNGSETKVELKYCERCGGLFLRQPGDVRVHCAGCTSHFAKQHDREAMRTAASVRKPRKRRMRDEAAESGKIANAGHIRCLQGVAGAEVWA